MHTEICRTLENKKVAPDHFVLTLSSSKIGRAAKPGQFVQILCSDSYEPFLPRPFSFLEASSKKFSILYQVVGKGTALLGQLKKGEGLRVLGPLGVGFSGISFPGQAIFVGGGVGIPPLHHLAQVFLRSKKAKDIIVLLGARHKSLLLCESDFRKLGVDLRVATDDGSKGRKGLVTELLKTALADPKRPKIFACGPTPMLKAVSKISVERAVPSEISVEVPMACGFGACLGCAIKVRSGNGNEKHRFAIACVEGPVFDGQKILWD